MTNEEAIQFLSQIMDALLASNSWLPSTDNPIKESFGMAINALQAQEVSNNSPELDNKFGDLISRQAVIDALDMIGSVDTDADREYAMEVFMSLPSAQPDSKELSFTHKALDTVSRQAVIDAILAVTGNSSVRELYEHVQEHELSDMWSGGVVAAIDTIIALPSAQSEPLSDAYTKAVWKWLLDYQIKAAELKGRYTPYEVLSWVANDWRKEHERSD